MTLSGHKNQLITHTHPMHITHKVCVTAVQQQKFVVLVNAKIETYFIDKLFTGFLFKLQLKRKCEQNGVCIFIGDEIWWRQQ